MFKYLAIFLCLIFPFFSYGKDITILNCKDCMEIDVTDTNEVWGNVSGGVKKKASYLGMTEIDVGLNLDKIFEKPYGDFKISAVNVRGNPMSNSNLQTLDFVSNIENYNSTRLYEFYYENQIDKNWYIKIGKIDFTNEFNSDDATSSFLNASMGTSMVVNNNTFNMTNYGPSTSVGAVVKYSSDNWSIKGAISDDNPYIGNRAINFQNINTDQYGVDIHFKHPMFYLEYQYNTKFNNLDGSYYVGGFYDDGPTPVSYGGRRKGNGAFYLTMNQELYKNDVGSLKFFMRYVYDPFPQKTDITYTFDTGLMYSYDNDYFGVGLGMVHLNKRVPADYNHHDEYRIEATYNHQIDKYFSIQPDIQYIIHPGSTNRKNELVFGLRETFTY